MASSGRKKEMVRGHRLLFDSLLLFLVVFFPHAPRIIVRPWNAYFVDSFTRVRGPSLNRCRKFGAARNRPLASKYNSDVDGSIDDTSNTTISTELNSTQKETTGYRRIEDWHEETRDSKHVIRHLKRERAKWTKAFDNLEKGGGL